MILAPPQIETGRENMKCELCGQEIEKMPTNLDRLKTCRNENDIDKLVDKLCTKKTCPFSEICPVRLKDGNCLWGTFTDWLLKETE